MGEAHSGLWRPGLRGGVPTGPQAHGEVGSILPCGGSPGLSHLHGLLGLGWPQAVEWGQGGGPCVASRDVTLQGAAGRTPGCSATARQSSSCAISRTRSGVGMLSWSLCAAWALFLAWGAVQCRGGVGGEQVPAFLEALLLGPPHPPSAGVVGPAALVSPSVRLSRVCLPVVFPWVLASCISGFQVSTLPWS